MGSTIDIVAPLIPSCTGTAPQLKSPDKTDSFAGDALDFNSDEEFDGFADELSELPIAPAPLLELSTPNSDDVREQVPHYGEHTHALADEASTRFAAPEYGASRADVEVTLVNEDPQGCTSPKYGDPAHPIDGDIDPPSIDAAGPASAHVLESMRDEGSKSAHLSDDPPSAPYEGPGDLSHAEPPAYDADSGGPSAEQPPPATGEPASGGVDPPAYYRPS